MQDNEPAPEFFLLILDLYAPQPQFTTGWFCDRWSTMTTDERTRWIVTNLDALRAMWVELGDLGFGKFGDDLPTCLELLDAQMPLEND